ncbi:hypothetical protein ACA910_000585 [Epithemia clementina (nom. ined.)]
MDTTLRSRKQMEGTKTESSKATNEVVTGEIAASTFVPVVVEINHFIQPTPNDVLLKSGEESRNNPGNILFHKVSSTIKARFDAATDKHERDALARELATAVDGWGGRFLGYDSTNLQWYEIDARRRHRKCLTELIKKKDSTRAFLEEKMSSIYTDETTSQQQKEESNHSEQGFSSQNLDNAGRAASKCERKQDTDQRAHESHELFLSQSILFERLFQSLNSRSQIFSSTESFVEKLLASQSGTPVNLPSLSEIEKNQDSLTMPIPRQEPFLNSSGPSRAGTSSSVGTNNTDQAMEEARERQNLLIQELLQSISRAAQSTIVSQTQPGVEKSSLVLSSHAAATAAVEFFASRGWGTELGPVQDLDFQQVFQSNHKNEEQDDGKASGRTLKPSPAGPSKKRDWNAIVLKGLEASMFSAKPSQEVSVQTNQTPADALLQLAATALHEKREPSSSIGAGSSASTSDESTEEVTELATPCAAPLSQACLCGSAESCCCCPVAPNSQQDQDFETDENESLEKPVLQKLPKPPAEKPTLEANASARKPNSYSASPRFVEPNDLDVLLGRGGRTNNHPGNKTYLEVKDRMQSRYLAADKNGKTPISQELVDIVHGWGGRFLKLEPGENRWFEVDEITARKKCSQTLREINTPDERAAKRAKYAK